MKHLLATALGLTGQQKLRNRLVIWAVTALTVFGGGWAAFSQVSLAEPTQAVREVESSGRLMQVADLAISSLQKDGGCTIDPRTASTVGAVDAWAVSVAGAEKSQDTLPSRADILSYLRCHATVFHGSSNVYLGCWYDSESKRWFLDVSVLIQDRQEAETFGRTNNQRCIFHLQTKQEVRLVETQTSGV